MKRKNEAETAPRRWMGELEETSQQCNNAESEKIVRHKQKQSDS
jgi:hypothetical protein